MKQYINVLKRVLEKGKSHSDRTGVGRCSIFGVQERFNLQDGFPLVTTRKIFTRGMIEELLWFIRGSTDTNELKSKDVNIWNPWAVEPKHISSFANEVTDDKDQAKFVIDGLTHNGKVGQIGPMYGAIWRNAPQDKVHLYWPFIEFTDIPSDKLPKFKEEYEAYLNHVKNNPETPGETEVIGYEDFCRQRYMYTVDQLNDLIIGLKQRPFSSRHVVTAWIPALIPFETVSPQKNVLLERGALAPCHMMFQCFVTPGKAGEKNKLSLMMLIRSNDLAVGAPYNIAQYSLLLAMLAHVTDMVPHEFIWSIGDAHIYMNQINQVEEQVTRSPLPLPKLWLNPEVKDLFAFTVNDIRIEGYEYHPEIKYEVAV
jgi:thymidylate synthase